MDEIVREQTFRRSRSLVREDCKGLCLPAGQIWMADLVTVIVNSISLGGFEEVQEWRLVIPVYYQRSIDANPKGGIESASRQTSGHDAFAAATHCALIVANLAAASLCRHAVLQRAYVFQVEQTNTLCALVRRMKSL